MPDSESSSVIMVSVTPEITVDEGPSETTPAEQVKDKKPATAYAKESEQSKSAEAPQQKDKKKKKEKNKDAEADDEDSSSDDGDEEPKEKILIGAAAEHKNLYQKFDKHNCMSWTDKYPEDLEEAAENDETLKYAVIVRNRRPKDNSRKVLEIDSIIIQSPFIKKVLAKVLEDYPGINTSLSRLTFSSPFQCFVHRWDRFAAAMKSDEWDETTKKHLKVLYNILYPELKDVISSVEDYLKNGVITYEHVWTILQPGCTVFASRYNHPIALKFEQGFYGETQCDGPCYILNTVYVDWDGTRFGHGSMTQTVPAFHGVIPITDLPCFPLEFHPDFLGTIASLTSRGRLFEQLAGYHYKHYNGQGITKENGYTIRVTVNCRVVIDAAMYAKFNPNMTKSLRTMRRSADGNCFSGNCGSSDFSDDYYSEPDEDDIERGDKPNKRIPLTPEELLLCTPMVKGYALKVKRWLEFYVGDVSEVIYNEQAFDSLVLPEDQKELILAFAQSQVKFKDEFDDVIQGKGKGIIMLLSGGPGIGKTLTAESVAEEMRVPLYIMSAGDLGSDADLIEYNLSQILEMVAKWNAVLLLDECDVFLECRSPHDLARNRIVSIFLRTLEYYEGILFLTTNRVNDMDPAFHSRIHISLEYPPLDEAARKSVWAGFLNRNATKGTVAHCLDEAEIAKLAKLDINGRQIKNVLKTANLLACHKGQKLGFSHLRTVLTVEGHKVE